MELSRDIGFVGAYTIGLGTMIGAGVFILPSIAAGDAGPASIISFLVGGFVSLLAALSLSEMSTGLPQTGGSYHYINTALGSLFGSIAGWSLWAGLTFASAFYMLGFGQYLAFFYGDLSVSLAALLMAGFLVLVNVYGVRETGWLQNFIVTILVGLILVFIVFGFPQVETGRLTPFNPEGWSAVVMTVGTIYVSFIGFEVIADIAEEVKNPQRNIPLAMIAAVITPTVFYALVMFISLGVLPIEELAVSDIPVADVAAVYMGGIGTLAMVIGAVFATVSSANSSILAASRINYAMGRDRVLSNWFNEIHSRFRTPYRSILATGAIIFVLISIGAGIDTLAKVAGFAYLVTYSLVHISLIVMRNVESDLYNPSFKAPGYPYVQIVGLVAGLFILIQMGTVVLTVGILIAVFGLAWYFLYVKGRTDTGGALGDAVRSGEALKDEEKHYKVLVPLSNPETEKELMKIATQNASMHERSEVIALNVIVVPPQASLSHSAEFEEKKLDKQKELLEAARKSAEEADVNLSTKAVLGRSVSKVITNVIEEENVDHLVLGWEGDLGTKEYILGTKIDPIIEQAECEVSVVKTGTDEPEIGDIAAFVGEGPNTPLAIRRAHELSKHKEAGQLTLINVQTETNETTDADKNTAGENLIHKMAKKAGIKKKEYQTKVVVSSNRHDTLLKEAEKHDTVCIGAVRKQRLKGALFGSLQEEIGEKASSTVIMVRDARLTPKTLIRKLKSLIWR
ncbi:amino acid permease [Methanonatronarchaeum sp. AMET6-2]|uniref:amino acid permease n=1 Tax=Methanonatronarchaeum sp. AMET6-2 TaxID=2933293 RepID=UPI001219C574|nr:amino acid permease [Methanonatronarchaeum sp. AMET6-2]RZN61962.1 MAG: amino acid permease [Methanonatronarchaeia archaeon]UOY09380.1 amino acid permease [Methanonatronarchaeum sp. AMET6-2]